MGVRIVTDDAIPYLRGTLEPWAEMEYLPGNIISRADLKHADAILVRTRTMCNAELLEGSAVRMVASATAGTDHIDRVFCAREHISVCAAPGSNARGVLQWWAAALALLCRRGLAIPGKSTIGVVGTGCVGSLVALYSRYWGFEVMCCDPPLERSGASPVSGGTFQSFDDIARNCNIITFHVPLSATGDFPTFHMAGPDFFENILPGAVIVNAARGEVIDSSSLLRHMLEGRGYALVDTWENEPAPEKLLIESALIATPHIAGYTRQGKANATAMVVNAVSDFFHFPLGGWYPCEVKRIEPQMITFDSMLSTIDGYFDITAQSKLLKENPERFEQFRNAYNYREEYF